MRYVISDVHGCYDEYMKLLRKIHFSDADELYVLGDAMDRGPEPVKVIADMMSRVNVTYILGNHDFIMLTVMRKLFVEITEENCENYLSKDDLMDYINWMQDGGEITLSQFTKLTRREQRDILEYLEDAFLYQELEDKGKRYVLVHAGIRGYEKGKELYEYNFTDFIFHRPDYSKPYFEEDNVYVITGHTPTVLIRADRQPKVYCGNGHIAVDCGCVFGGNLAAYCIETGEVFYVEGRKHKR
ncbi:MAG: metallophosphoesterase [Schaedlerella sp.]|nr:fructose-bisphosphatase class III [Lachnospiraceae bacterium]MDY4202554.1 metallophosphoesterase [Schaedlerella sp.]